MFGPIPTTTSATTPDDRKATAVSDDLNPLNDFRGLARLFPLPNLVLFPSVIQPLHVFEPRYLQLMEDALKGDHLIGMALLQPDCESDYYNNPPIYPIICLGRIHKEERLPDGRWNLLLHGLTRARVESEVDGDRLYRVARVGLIPEKEVASASAAKELRRQLGLETRRWFAAHEAAVIQLEKLLHSDLTLGALCDVFGFALPIAIEVKQQLLEEVDVVERTRRLIAHLETTAPPEIIKAPPRRFPPEFSSN
jgi:Lon protease-like protein